ncbi:hypothetical protein MBANPS3_004213 [Mucor bainieri]
MVQRATLLWLCATSLASSVFCSRNSSRLIRRADVVDKNFEKCRGDTEWENDILARFTGIFFGDFTTTNSQDILGALAVQGTFSAPNYVVNANNGANCTDLSSLNAYGLVVGGTVNTYNTQVHGSAFINGGGNIDQIKQLNAGCVVTDKRGTGLFDFTVVEQLLVETSEDFATYPPTLVLSNDGTVKELRQNVLDYYEIITFHSCEQAICSLYTDLESQIDSIFLGSGNWNGIKSAVNPDKAYVFNIPVKNGNTIIIDTNSPSLGFNPCKVVLNFYPVDSDGVFMPLGEFTLLRKTGSQLGGLTLAPRGHIIDGSTGNFAGNIVGLTYLWENSNAGTEIHNYRAAGGNCDMYHGCLPVHLNLPPPQFNAETLTLDMPSTSAPPATESTSIVSYTSISVPERVAISTSTYIPCPTALETTDTTTDTETDTVTVVEPAKTVMVLLGTVTEVIDTVTEPGTTVTQPAITVTQLAGTLTQLVGTVTVASGSTTLTEVQATTETSTATAILTEDHTTTRVDTVTTTAIQVENTTTTTTQIESVTATTTVPNSIEITTTTQAGLLETVTVLLVKPTTEISAVVTFTSTQTNILTASVCTETDAIFTTKTTTIGYFDTTSSANARFKKHYHKGSDKVCYEDDEDDSDDQ